MHYVCFFQQVIVLLFEVNQLAADARLERLFGSWELGF